MSIREYEFHVDVFSGGPQAPRHIRVTHVPTGQKYEETSTDPADTLKRRAIDQCRLLVERLPGYSAEAITLEG